jgi:hypothetical protein
MQWVKIQIPNRAESATAFMEMTRRGRIDCYVNDTYVVPEPALRLLTDLGIKYHEQGRGGRDWAEKMLRDTLAAYAQRRTAGESTSVPGNAR